MSARLIAFPQRYPRLGAALASVTLVAGLAQAKATRVEPGGLWVVSIPRGEGQSATVTLLKETHSMFRRGDRWVAPLAIYARTQPGSYVAVAREVGAAPVRLPLIVSKKAFPTQRITMKPGKTGLQSPDILRRERQILSAAYQKTAPEPLWHGAFQLPLSDARVSSDFGRTRYVNGKFWSQHGGLDLAAPSGKVTVAGNDGRVILARKLWMRGNTLALDHGMGVISVYNHLSAFLVKEGDTVVKGQAVAKVGATGFVTGPHLHWEIRAGGTPTNPWPLIRKGIRLPETP